MDKYYDGTKLLSLKDQNGNLPEIYIVDGNRTSGKTTYFGRLVVRRFLRKHEKFILLYRYKYEISDCADKFFADIGSLFFPGYAMAQKNIAKGNFAELRIGSASEENIDYYDVCGYAISLNSSEMVKKYSHIFNDCTSMIFDEFQAETNVYCKDEVQKLISIHTSVARGHGEQVRYVPVYMLGNHASLINPYYVMLGISTRLKPDTKFLRGNGFVLEMCMNLSAKEAQEKSAFNQAFSKHRYIEYSSENVYLNDSMAFVDKINDKFTYLCTIKVDGKSYAIKECETLGFIYCDDRVDNTFKTKLAVTTDDHDVNYIMLKNNDYLIGMFRNLFRKGAFRFKNLMCKEAVLKLLSY